MDLTRAATVMLSDALDRIGDPFALHGFCSDGRHDVHYTRFKDFGKPYDDVVKARLAGMKGAYSTRMGAALRHAVNRGALLLLGPAFPFGTLIVNVFGSFLMGVVVVASLTRGEGDQSLRIFLGTGMLDIVLNGVIAA